MEYTFLNGTIQQRDLWEEAARRLLNLPFDDIPLVATVSFVGQGELTKQTTLAETDINYGSNVSAMRVRDSAPDFGDAVGGLEADAAALGLPWNDISFYGETSIHELGHAFYAVLPEASRVAIAQMFGAKSDDYEELHGAANWKDRVGEAIADTFKEAFLPRQLRIFPNRTNIKLSYLHFPRFRAYFREFETINDDRRSFLIPGATELGEPETVDGWRPAKGAPLTTIDEDQDPDASQWESFTPIASTTKRRIGTGVNGEGPGYTVEYFLPYPAEAVTAMTIKDFWEAQLIGLGATATGYLDVNPIAKTWSVVTTSESFKGMYADMFTFNVQWEVKGFRVTVELRDDGFFSSADWLPIYWVNWEALGTAATDSAIEAMLVVAGESLVVDVAIPSGEVASRGLVRGRVGAGGRRVRGHQARA